MREVVLYNYSFLLEGAMTTLTAGRLDRVWFARLLISGRVLELPFDPSKCSFRKDGVFMDGNSFSKRGLSCDLNFSGLRIQAHGEFETLAPLPPPCPVLTFLGFYRASFDAFGLTGVFSGRLSVAGKTYGPKVFVTCYSETGRGALQNGAVLSASGGDTGVFLAAGGNKLADLHTDFWTAGVFVEDRTLKLTKANSRLMVFEDSGHRLEAAFSSKEVDLHIMTELEGEFSDASGRRRSADALTRFRLSVGSQVFVRTDLPASTEIIGKARIKAGETDAEAVAEQAGAVTVKSETPKK